MIDIKQIGETGDWENFGGVKYKFCTKTQDPGSQYFSQDWPKGRYLSYERVGTLENQNVQEVSLIFCIIVDEPIEFEDTSGEARVTF